MPPRPGQANGSPELVVLLPPSEGKAIGGDGPAWTADTGQFAALARQRARIGSALARARGGNERLLGVGGAHLDRARVANCELKTGPPSRPAAERYTGVVYDHLDLASLSRTARQRASASIIVLSGLLGAVGIDDPTPDYRLKMGASLAPLGKLSSWWRPTLSAALNERLAGCFVVDLLPQEHRAAWLPEPGGCTLVKVSFVERDGKVAGHDAKAAKGLLVRHLMQSTGDSRRALERFAHERFTLDLHRVEC